MKFESKLDAIVLSANDVIANILIVDVDEEGYAPLQLAQIALPLRAMNRRKKAGDKSLFQRGDQIEISCLITNHAQNQFKEKDIKELSELMIDQSDEDKWENLAKAFESEKKFAEEWEKIEQDGRCLLKDLL